MSRQPWQRLKSESSKAYQAFCIYYQLPARERSIDEAWRRASPDQNQIGRRAESQWFAWSTKFNWPARAAAYDEFLSEQDRLLWEDRRRLSKERDYAQADALRSQSDALAAVVTAAIPTARLFIHERRTVQEDGTVIRTLSFDITGLSRVAEVAAGMVEKASKIQRLVTGESTENVQLSAAALDAVIRRELANLADRGEAGAADALAPDDARTDGDA